MRLAESSGNRACAFSMAAATFVFFRDLLPILVFEGPRLEVIEQGFVVRIDLGGLQDFFLFRARFLGRGSGLLV